MADARREKMGKALVAVGVTSLKMAEDDWINDGEGAGTAGSLLEAVGLLLGSHPSDAIS